MKIVKVINKLGEELHLIKYYGPIETEDMAQSFCLLHSEKEADYNNRFSYEILELHPVDKTK